MWIKVRSLDDLAIVGEGATILGHIFLEEEVVEMELGGKEGLIRSPPELRADSALLFQLGSSTQCLNN